MADQANELLPETILPDVYRQIRAKTKRFQVGMLPNGPASNFTLGGINFPVTTKDYDKRGTDENPFTYEGAVVELTIEQCKRIKDDIRCHIVRWFRYPETDKQRAGQKMRAEIWDARTRAFMPREGDEPLVKYLFFKDAPAEELIQPAPTATFDALDKAIAEAEASEGVVRTTQPEDARTRARHAELKSMGKGLTPPDLGKLS